MMKSKQGKSFSSIYNKHIITNLAIHPPTPYLTHSRIKKYISLNKHKGFIILHYDKVGLLKTI